MTEPVERQIDDPVINSPFQEPQRYYEFDDEGITNRIVSGRRVSSYFVPIPRSRKRGKNQQLSFESEWTQDRVEENKFVEDVRRRVGLWRAGGYVGVTRTTRRLLEYWQREGRERRLFFAQIEAIETAIYIAEVAQKYGDGWIINQLRDVNEAANPGLFRIAFKLCTGGGKTTVMATLIAWQALNKLANPHDARFTDTFLLISPGLTIRDRLRVLLPTDPSNTYKALDLLPSDLFEELKKARIAITNYHAFLLRERTDASALTKRLSGQQETGINKESPDQMVRRVCRDFGSRKNIIVINDEAHHCYRDKPNDEGGEKLKGEDRKEAEERNEEARVWLRGIEAIAAKIGVKAVYDLSATPFFLRGSGYQEGTIFPWVVSDFSLIDGIESGIVKVPRVPVSDSSMTGDQPSYRDLWVRIRDDLPRKGRSSEEKADATKLPALLQGAIHTLYDHYKIEYERWEKDAEAQARGAMPPVLIVVCQNTNHSNLIYRYMSGYETEITGPDGQSILAEGALPIFSNVRDGRWLHRPNTILVDSAELDRGSLSDEFKKVAAREIDLFKDEMRLRFPGRDPNDLSESDLLREVMNTVGKAGRLGENVKCVVSVSMLTEGWDANTVTHILGVRAFGTQLLCEQVVGRGLRRISYAPIHKTITVNGETVEIETFGTEYAEVFGIPFSFIPTAGANTPVRQERQITRVRALPERTHLAIHYPRVVGYRYVLPRERLKAQFADTSKMVLSDADVPTETENAPIVGQSTIMTLGDLKRHREQEVAFLLAKVVIERYFPVEAGEHEAGDDLSQKARVQHWLFPDLLAISRRWLDECVIAKGRTFKQMLLLVELAGKAADRIYASIVRATEGEKHLLPILHPYDETGSTDGVDFDTTKATFRTDPARCHVSHVVADTDSWEQKLAQVLEGMKDILSYVKNQNVGFSIPYTVNGIERQYVPDFLAVVDDGDPSGKPLHLIIEVSGENRPDKQIKVETARDLWVPAVNNAGQYGRWSFVNITDPWDAENLIRAHLNGLGRLGQKVAA